MANDICAERAPDRLSIMLVPRSPHTIATSFERGTFKYRPYFIAFCCMDYRLVKVVA